MLIALCRAWYAEHFNVFFWVQYSFYLSFLLQCINCQNLSHSVIHYILLLSLLETKLCRFYPDQNDWFYILIAMSVFHAGDGVWMNGQPHVMRNVFLYVIWCKSHNQQMKKKSRLNDKDMIHILVSDRNRKLYLFLLTELLNISARNLCPSPLQEILSSQHTEIVMENPWRWLLPRRLTPTEKILVRYFRSPFCTQTDMASSVR